VSVAATETPALSLEPAPWLTARRWKAAFGAALVLALALRLIAIAATPHFTPINDAADYDRYAVSLIADGKFPSSQLAPGPTAFRPPLFPLALSAAYEVSGVGSPSARWEAGRLLEAVLGTVTVGLIGLIALRLWGPLPALIASTLGALYPPLILVGSSLMSESLYIPLGLAAVLAALVHRGSSHRLRWAIAAGVLAALAALTRATMLALVVPILFLVWDARPLLSWPALRAPLAALIAAVLTLIPWTVRNEAVLHSFVPVSTETGYALVGTYNSEAQRRSDYPALWLPPIYEAARVRAVARGRNEAQLSDTLTGWAVDYAKAHPGSVAKVSWWSSLRLLNLTGTRFERWIEPTWGYDANLASLSVYSFWVVGTLALLGILTVGARRAPWAFWLCPISVLLPTVVVVGATRYRSPADPFVVMLAALAIAELSRRLAGRSTALRSSRPRAASEA
jgi:4-amino-4-deoxy-L-arabinose transferase-like glycosyltransferase